MILFNEEKHVYTFEGIPLTSVSGLLGMVKQPFERDKWLEKKSKERGITKEELSQEWDEIRDKALAKGTKYHKEREEKLIKENGWPIIMGDEGKIAYDLNELRDGWYPELILYSLKYGVCGTADRVLIKGKEFELRDWKSNKAIEFNSFKKFDPILKERFPVKMLEPLSHLEDCNGIHYTLQLSIYAYLLEQFGYKCTGLILDHVIFEEDEPVGVVTYNLNYLKKEVISLLNWFKNANSPTLRTVH